MKLSRIARLFLCLLVSFLPFRALSEGATHNVTPDLEAFSRNPDVAYIHGYERFFVVWQTDEGDVLGRWVKHDGSLGPVRTLFKSNTRSPSLTLRFSFPAIAYQANGSPDGEDAIFVTARMTQRFISGGRILQGEEIVGIRLDVDGLAQTAPIGLSDTSIFGAAPVPAADLDGAPDIAAAPNGEQGSPFVVWTQGAVLRGRWWPEFIRSGPFQMNSPGPLTVYDSPAAVFQPATEETPARYVTALPEKAPRRPTGVAVVAHEVGSTASEREVQIATPPLTLAPRGGSPLTRQDVSIGYGGETFLVVYNDPYEARRSVVNQITLEGGKESIIPFFYLWNASEQFPVTVGFRGGFASAYDTVAFGNFSVGYAIGDKSGATIEGFTARGPNEPFLLQVGVEHLAIDADDESGFIGIVWNDFNFLPSATRETDVLIFIRQHDP